MKTDTPVKPTAAPVTAIPHSPPSFAPTAHPPENSSRTDRTTVSGGNNSDRICAALPKNVTDAITEIQEEAAEDTAAARCAANPDGEEWDGGDGIPDDEEPRKRKIPEQRERSTPVPNRITPYSRPHHCPTLPMTNAGLAAEEAAQRTAASLRVSLPSRTRAAHPAAPTGNPHRSPVRRTDADARGSPIHFSVGRRRQSGPARSMEIRREESTIYGNSGGITRFTHSSMEVRTASDASSPRKSRRSMAEKTAAAVRDFTGIPFVDPA